MSIKNQIEKIIENLQASIPDAEKVDTGKVGSPGTRVRSAAQEAKKALDELRKAVQGAREARKEEAE